MAHTGVSLLVESYLDGEITRRDLVVGALRLGLGVSAAGGLLAGCSSSRSRPAAAGVSSPATGRLTGSVQVLVGFGTGNSPSQLPVQQALANAFMRLHPGVTVSFLRVTGGATEAGTKLTTLAAGGGLGPTIAIPVGIYGVSLFLDQGVWLDLRPLLDRDGISLDSFLPVSLDAVRATSYYGPSSQAVLGMPIGVNDHALAYNEELFAAAGVAPPPTSWTDPTWTLEPGGRMLAAATELTVDDHGRHPGEAGFRPEAITRFGLGNFFRHTLYFDYGAHIYDPATRTAQFDTPEAVAGLQFAADLVNRYHVLPSATQLAAAGAAAGAGGDQNAAAWRAGKLAMIDMCTCNVNTAYTTNLPFSFKLAAMPAGPKRRFCFLNLDLGCIVAPSANHELSWELLKFLTVDPQPELALALRSDGAIPPLRANSGQFVSQLSPAVPGADPSVWVAGLPYASEENEEWLPAFAQVNDLEGPAFDQVTAGAPAAQVLPRLQRQAQAAIDAWLRTHKLP